MPQPLNIMQPSIIMLDWDCANAVPMIDITINRPTGNALTNGAFEKDTLSSRHAVNMSLYARAPRPCGSRS